MRSLSTPSLFRILLWRTWSPIHAFSATFSALTENSIGGTCSQVLWHARNLRLLGHEVQVLGVAHEDRCEEGVDFVAASGRTEQGAAIRSGRVRPPDVVLLEGDYAGAAFFRARFPAARIVHVGHNIDRAHERQALAARNVVDLFAMVGPGQLAEYAARFPALRHKFMLLRDVVPWEWLYRDLPALPVTDEIAWVGGWTKLGLRQWAETMERILAEHSHYRWTLYGPSYSQDTAPFPAHLFQGLSFNADQLRVCTLPLVPLVQEIRRARIVLVSLGHETACISALDAHAMGRPVLSGNDMTFKYANPEGTGIRVTTAAERYAALSHLLSRPALCDRLGAMGHEVVCSEFIEANQREDLRRILAYVMTLDDLGPLSAHTAPSARSRRLAHLYDRVRRKVRTYRARSR